MTILIYRNVVVLLVVGLMIVGGFRLGGVVWMRVTLLFALRVDGLILSLCLGMTTLWFWVFVWVCCRFGLKCALMMALEGMVGVYFMVFIVCLEVLVVGVGCRFFAMCWFEFVLLSVGFIGLKLDELVV